MLRSAPGLGWQKGSPAPCALWQTAKTPPAPLAAVAVGGGCSVAVVVATWVPLRTVKTEPVSRYGGGETVLGPFLSVVTDGVTVCARPLPSTVTQSLTTQRGARSGAGPASAGDALAAAASSPSDTASGPSVLVMVLRSARRRGSSQRWRTDGRGKRGGGDGVELPFLPR